MAGNDGAFSIHAVAMRVALLSTTGTTPASAGAMYVFGGIIKFDYNPEMDAGADTSNRDAAGNLCQVYRTPDVVKRYTVSLQVCAPDPELEVLVTGGTTLTSGGTILGFQHPAMGTDPVPNGISLELWTRAVINGVQDPTRPWFWWAFPRLFNMHKTNRTADTNPLANTYDGFAGENANWGNGPNNDWLVDSTKVYQVIRTATIPTAALGAQAVPAQT